MVKSLMVQGTGSHVGKSILTAALCRIFRDRGINVAPFKSQNMALNSFITESGGEMGRAQVVQAEAAGLIPCVDMNPILIKPHADMEAQVIIQGKVHGNFSAKDFHNFKSKAMPFVEDSYKRLAKRHELIVIEGAGSPAEINLRENDIANMGTAHLVDAPVLLVGDIDKGGVFASIVGTLELLDEADRSRIKGFIINKFRGDISLLKPGLDFLEERTGLPVLGVIPYFRDIYIQEEDSVNLESLSPSSSGGAGKIRVALLYLPHISNFTDFDPLEREEDVDLRYVRQGERIGDADIIIIPGSKSTISDLGYLRKAGYADEIRKHVERGGRLIGICGGYQMLGESISDPCRVEAGGELEGLGLLDIETALKESKETHQVAAVQVGRENILKGYEIHMGESSYLNGASPLFEIKIRGAGDVKVGDGAMSFDGRVWGTYIHGIFDNDDFRKSVLDEVRKEKGVTTGDKGSAYTDLKEEGYRQLAELVESNLDMEAICRIAGLHAAKPEEERKEREEAG
ncbi:MAG: cobyric acid synthase [bacterium]|nr:cobyric acid synthase [bacterium]